MNTLTTKEFKDLEELKNSNKYGIELVTKNLNNNYQKVENSVKYDLEENIKYIKAIHTWEMETKPMELIARIEDGLDLESVIYREDMAFNKKQVELNQYFWDMQEELENKRREVQKLLKKQFEELNKTTRSVYKGRG